MIEIGSLRPLTEIELQFVEHAAVVLGAAFEIARARVVLGQQQQVSAHGLINRILDLAIDVQGHQLDGLGADTGLHAGAHFR